jgi:hypothetical protein
MFSHHPQVYVPNKRKEVHYFDRYFERGLAWYESFFPREYENDQYLAIGEITPHYLYCSECPDRIKKIAGIKNLLLLLRHPVDRAYSHYWFRVRVDNYKGGFREFLRDYPEALAWGMYAKHTRRYLTRFHRDQILILTYEDVFDDVEKGCRKIAKFLEIYPEGFHKAADPDKINPGYIPRYPKIHAFSARIARRLRREDKYDLIRVFKRLGLKRLLSSRAVEPPKLNPLLHKELTEHFGEDVEDLEDLIGLDLSRWKAV